MFSHAQTHWAGGSVKRSWHHCGSACMLNMLKNKNKSRTEIKDIFTEYKGMFMRLGRACK